MIRNVGCLAQVPTFRTAPSTAEDARRACAPCWPVWESNEPCSTACARAGAACPAPCPPDLLARTSGFDVDESSSPAGFGSSATVPRCESRPFLDPRPRGNRPVWMVGLQEVAPAAGAISKPRRQSSSRRRSSLHRDAHVGLRRSLVSTVSYSHCGRRQQPSTQAPCAPHSYKGQSLELRQYMPGHSYPEHVHDSVSQY
jgi:hypothetical protein